MSFWLALVLLAIAAVFHLKRYQGDVAAGMPGDGPIWGLDGQEIALLATVLAIILLVVPGLFGAHRGRAGRAFRDILGWSAIAVAGVGAYNYRDEIGEIAFRIAGELGQPPVVQQVEPTGGSERSVRIRRRKDGHFTATVSVNGASVPMLVDTGASTVVLRQADARKLGLDTAALKYTVPVQTANGVAYAAHVRLRHVMVGSITLSGVDALVAQPGALKESLLGMTFLSRLRSYEFSGQYLTFRN
jgi:aspartyl protease family protein